MVAGAGNGYCCTTGRFVETREVNCYYDGSQTLTPKYHRRSSNTTLIGDRKNIIFGALEELFIGKARTEVEINANTRYHKSVVQATNRCAREIKLPRSKWHEYYFLFLTKSTRRRRFVPTTSTLQLLTQKIYEFWVMLFTADGVYNNKKMIIFTATCVSELAEGMIPLFPKVTWIKESLGGHSVLQLYTHCLDITCRSMTCTLMQINTLAQQKQIREFPL